MTPLAFCDVETTGVHPDRRAWEIAIIRRDDNGTREHVWQVSDVDLSNADPIGLSIGRFYERHALYAPPPVGPPSTPVDLLPERAVAAHVEIWTRGAHLVGCVPDFDARTLDPMLRRHRLIPDWHYHLVDVEAMAVGWLNGQAETAASAAVLRAATSPPWKSDELSLMCGVESPSEAERHTALGDARWAMRWYDKMVGRA